MTTRREQEQKEYLKYQQSLDNQVTTIVREGEKQGITYTDKDKKIIRITLDERNYNDIQVSEEFIKLQEQQEKS